MTKNNSLKTYIKYYLISLGSLLGFILCFNIIIDPYGDFRLINLQKINSEKTLSASESQGKRRSKANELSSSNYDTIILGTSRALVGIDPKHKVFQDSRVYNLALAGSNVYEIHKAYQYAQKSQKLEKVVFSLDFFAFSHKGMVRGDFDRSKFSEKGYLFRILSNHISFDNFMLSLKTLKNNYQGLKQTNQLGFDNSKLESKVQKDPNYRSLFDEALTENFFVMQRAYAGYVYSQHRLDLFREVVANCLANDTELYLFISPVHARQIEAISAIGLFPTFEQWKRDLVTIIEEESAKLGKEPPRLWDFSGYNSMTTEAVPLAGEKGEMQWYYESSHYTKDLGDILLDKIFSDPQQVPNSLDDFGTIVNSQNIEQHLAKIRQDRELYRVNYTFEVAEVERLFQSVKDREINTAEK